MSNSELAIQPVKKYKYNGKEYKSLTHVNIEVENQLGGIIDYKMPASLTPAQKLAILGALVSNKGALVKLLTVEFYRDSSVVNILDL